MSKLTKEIVADALKTCFDECINAMDPKSEDDGCPHSKALHENDPEIKVAILKTVKAAILTGTNPTSLLFGLGFHVGYRAAHLLDHPEEVSELAAMSSSKVVN